jgi:hydrogenase-4 component E
MASPADYVLVLVLLLNFLVLGAGRLRALVYTVAIQGVLLGVLPLFVHENTGVREGLVSAAAIALKGLLIPRMLFRAMADLPIRREVEPIVGFRTSLLLGAAATGVSMALGSRLPVLDVHPTSSLLIPASFATVLTGFLILTCRRKAITQVLGYLILENGVFIFGMLLLQAMPFLVEVGVLLDLFVAIFVMGIMINHISREFSSISTDRLSTLRE